MSSPGPTLTPPRRRRRLAVLAALLLMGLLLAAVLYERQSLKAHASFVSPDGRYRIEVLRQPGWLPMRPGQASDAPGVVRLYDRRGQLLQQTDIAMVQMADEVHWTDKQVRIHLVADWDLPD